MKTVLYWFVQLTWGFPQTLAGAVLTAFLRLSKRDRKRPRFFRAVVTEWPISGSMALGGFIFLGKNATEEIAVHEYGHTIQSLILGPFFLPVIGIPSLFWANLPGLRKYREKNKKRYTWFYPEHWASFAGERSTGMNAYRG